MPRPGRIRKKSSKFADFQSTDEIEGLYTKKKGASSKLASKKMIPLKIDNFDSDDSDSDDSDSDIDMKEDSLSFNEDWGENVDPGDLLDDYKDDDFDNEGSLHVDEDAKNSRYKQKKTSLKDLQSAMKKRKSERKDKGKARFTAYMLWARATRPKIVEENPIMDFAAVNKRLGEMWTLVPYTQKHNWKRQAKKLEARGEKPKPGRTMISTGKAPSKKQSASGVTKPSNRGKLQAMYGKAKGGVGGKGSQTKGHHHHQPLATQNAPATTHRHSYNTPKKNSAASAVPEASPPAAFKVTGTSPIDVAAHLKLLGESLNNIGQKLKEHEGQIAVSGSLSVLLDSMLCVLGPLACLSNQLEETRGSISDRTLAGILDNIAYIMPGIV